MRGLLFPELSYKITGLSFQVQKEQGRFCRERQYADRLEQLLNQAGIKYKREVKIDTIKSNSPKGNISDFIIENKIVVDVKAKKFITKEDYFQMQRYLQAANLKLGLIINFRSTYIKPKRIINTEYDKLN